MSVTSRVEGYAQALFAVARAENDVDRVSDELHEVRQAFEGSDELRTTLTDPAIPIDRRIGVVERLVGGRATGTTVSLVGMIVTAGRAGDMPAIISRVIELAAEARDAVVAEVRTAQPLSDDQRARLAEALSSRTGKKVDVRVALDSSLLGGIVTQIGDTVIDGSVRTRIARLRDRA